MCATYKFVFMSYLIYHPKREYTVIKEVGKVYHDSFSGNQDPYVWNLPFLHSFCHITQIRKELGQIIFWCSGDTYPNFEKLYCDLVFKIESMHEWSESNSISETDPIVDNKQSYEHHYKWVTQHLFNGVKRQKKRITLKACKESSFQPQNSEQELIDIVPFLNNNGVTTDQLRNSISKTFQSKPFELEDKTSKELYEFLSKSDRKLFGKDLWDKYPKNE